MLARCQNVFPCVIEGLLPGTSGSAARCVLGLWSIEGEIEQKKLGFWGRLINSSKHLVQRKLLMIRIVRWKYRRKTSTGFVAVIMKIALKHNLWLHIIKNFLGDGTFPTNAQRKRVVPKAIQATKENTCREKPRSKGTDRHFRVICLWF